ncbi:MAG TPA: VOC family protein [Afipia sp.]
MISLDHIIWAVPDREEGMAHFERLTGIVPVIGGSHPGRGTRNALVSLGTKCYLELLAPDPEQPPADNFGAALRDLSAPKIFTFAVASSGLEALGEKARKADLPFRGPESWSRSLSPENTLHWEAAFIEGTQFAHHVPFFIDWLESRHPAISSPTGMSLLKFDVMHPDAEGLSRLYETLDIGIPVRRSDRPTLRAVLQGPRGELVLNS